MKEDLKAKILKDHADGMVLSDIAAKYNITAPELVNIIIKTGLADAKRATPIVENDNTSNTEVHDAVIETMLPLGEESLPKEEYRPNPNDIFMDMIVFGKDLKSVCFKYNLPEGDVGIILEDIYKELSDRVIPMDDIKDAIKKICAEVYLARFN